MNCYCVYSVEEKHWRAKGNCLCPFYVGLSVSLSTHETSIAGIQPVVTRFGSYDGSL